MRVKLTRRPKMLGAGYDELTSSTSASKKFKGIPKKRGGGIVIVFVLLFDGAVNTVGIQLESNWIFAVSHVFLWCFSFFLSNLPIHDFLHCYAFDRKNAFKNRKIKFEIKLSETINMETF